MYLNIWNISVKNSICTTVSYSIRINTTLNPVYNISGQTIHISDKFIKNVKSRINRLGLHVHKHWLYLLEQHGQSFKIWSAIIRINTRGKSLIVKLDPDNVNFAHNCHLYF